MSNLKMIGAAILGGLFVLFAFQNIAPVELTFLFWTFESRRFLVIFLSFVTGLVFGGFIASTWRMLNPSPRVKPKTPAP